MQRGVDQSDSESARDLGLRASLERLLGAPMSIEEFLPLAIRLAEEVAALHGRGQVHRMLEPANIQVDAATGEIALARAAVGDPTSIHGSLPYMSPEQTGRMNRPIDNRSDLYSLGVTLFQLLAGRLPFEAEDAVGWVHSHVARTPPPLDELRPSVPRVLADVVGKLLAKLPDDRYQSALGLRHDLVRCLRDWRADLRIAAFPLGEGEVYDQFRIPQTVYGRTVERAALRETVERVAEVGVPELVLISGYAGIGKSTLVRELRAVVTKRGRFITGKCEPYKRDIPYLPIRQAFRELVLDILAESDTILLAWQHRLARALGSHAKLVVDLVPELELVIGPQPVVPELPLTETETLLRSSFHALFAACGRSGRPLAMFIDDLQWADTASLQLVASLLADPDTHHLLIVGAYRDNEVDAGHPLMRALDPVRQSGARISDIILGPLSEDQLGELVADTLRTTFGDAAELAHLVGEKTGGNPFFAIQFLTALHGKGSIWFDRASRQWQWDVAQIRAANYTDNVAELMRGRLYALPNETQRALQRLACVGSSVEASTLALAFARDPAPALRPALEQGLLFESIQADRHVYRFPHDRVYEAAYALCPEPDRVRMHVEIGRRLLANTSREDLPERVFEIVNQLDRGLALLESREERERLAELHLDAGLRALRATAYASALRYFAAGSGLAGERRDLAFALELRRAECEILTAALDAAEQRLDALMQRAESVTDLAAVASARVALYTTRDRSDRAVEAALEYLRRVGVEWSAHPTEDEVRREYDRIWQQLGDRPIEALVDLPAMSDRDRCATMDILSQLQSPALFSDQNLHSLVICRMANTSLEHGNCDASCIGYVWLGTILRPRFGEPVAAFRFGQVGFDLTDRRRLVRWKARVYLDFGNLIKPWAEHLRTGVELVRHAFDAAREVGDVTFASYARNCLITLLLAQGEPLAAVQREAEAALAFVRKAKFGLVVDIITTQLQLIRTLRGLTPTLGAFDDDRFAEDRFEQHLESDPHLAIATCWYWVRKLQARFIAGDHAAAVAAAAKAQPLLWTSPSFFEAAEYTYYAALACAARHDEAPLEERPQLLEQLAAHHATLVVQAERCPDNFGCRAALAGAELARIRGTVDEAIRGYEQAINAAHAEGFVQNEAIAYEVAARFYRGLGRSLVADAYVREAHARYVRWDAVGKAQQLLRAHSEIAPEASATVGIRADMLDQLSLIKASQRISRMMDTDRLSSTLLRCVLEEGGAQRVVLVFPHDRELEIAAVATVDEPVAIAEARIPRSLLAYVHRTQERVLLDAATDTGRFASDPYFATRRPRSALCVPLRWGAESVALLYLENDLAPGAFTPQRLLALELLAAQALISLENARLLEREHAARTEAEAAKQRELLVGEVTALMSQSLDLRGVLRALARLCSQEFADWAVIDLFERDAIVRIAGAHRHAEKVVLLDELAARYPVRSRTASPVGRVLQTGEPLALPVILDGELRMYTEDDHHAELLRRLGTRSAVLVPLRARETSLGALTFVSATPNRFRPADLETARELARRMAMAIDNARLFEQTQRALHLRDEFLRVASHELRTPLASLRLTAESLMRAAELGRAVSPHTLDRSIRRVLGNTERLEQLTSDLLDATRIERGDLELVPAEVALDVVVRGIVEELELDFAAARCKVSIEYEREVIGRWDRSRLEQVVTNLLTNAMKFGPGKPIEIRIERAGDNARLSITDHGIGIDPRRRPFVFDRFERAVPSSSYGGLGLGLFIARSIVVAHGGTISVDSVPATGSTFTVVLPCAGPPARGDQALG